MFVSLFIDSYVQLFFSSYVFVLSVLLPVVISNPFAFVYVFISFSTDV